MLCFRSSAQESEPEPSLQHGSAAAPAWLSPSLRSDPTGDCSAYEMKFTLPKSQCQQLLAWAEAHLKLDPHCHSSGDAMPGYQVTSLYFDTPAWDVLYRRPGYDIHKYRLRRYGQDATIHAERKSKRDGRVWKHRTAISPASETETSWFAEEATALHLKPVCLMTYQRTAYLGHGPHGALRLTLDQALRGEPYSGQELAPVCAGVELFPEQFVLELKYLQSLPTLFKELIEATQLTVTGFSKYRNYVRQSGLAPSCDNALSSHIHKGSTCPNG